MVVIDVHTHISKKGCIPSEIEEAIVGDVAKRAGKAPEKVARSLEMYPTVYQASPENLIKDMDDARIDKSIMVTVDYGLAAGLSKPKVSIEEYNKWVADAADQHPDRLIAFAGVDPRRKNAVETLEKAVQEWGMNGLKLYPPCGFYPNEKVVTPIWEKANDLEIPVMVHSGPTFPQLKMKYSEPIYLEDVLINYPELNIIIAHSGGGLWAEEVIALRQFRNNLYADTSGWQGIAYAAGNEYATKRLLYLYSFLRSKCLFGSDWPAFNHQITHKEWVAVINGLDVKTKLKKKLLGENAEKLLKLLEQG